MQINFSKYQGTGNDFIMIDNRNYALPRRNREWIKALCHRRFGIGADGLIMLEENQGRIEMIYYNADGGEGSMCGNGGRCFAAFAKKLGLISSSEFSFIASDGPHEARFEADETISLRMKDVDHIESNDPVYVLNTGSPHYVKITSDIDKINVFEEGRKIRYSNKYAAEGINVNFIEPISEGQFRMRTYERGVEDETYSCGTGTVASAIALHIHTGGNAFSGYSAETPGGPLRVRFTEIKSEKKITDIWLQGPAEMTFEGQVEYLPA